MNSWSVQPPEFVRFLFHGTLWREETEEKIVYLTFDDGPVPEATPEVLGILREFGIKATFFCVGENVKKHPDIYRMLLSEGHNTGNHTFNHLQAFRTQGRTYLENVAKAGRYIDSGLFRPPHGQLYPWQIKMLRKKFDKIVMWDVLSKDYDASLSWEDVYGNVKKFVRPGSVIVFHDSLKALPHVVKALPVTIKYLLNQGYRFKLIE
ncbi:MAG: polysaccharide deacetylase family protein [Chlorobi bacterium]|nr:polysaccharide deacetylase family protein [Chlorobiota bacterium]